MNLAQNIIIFEGPDGCGKTNIATALSGHLNIPYFKNESEWEFFENDPSYFVNALTYGDPYFLFAALSNNAFFGNYVPNTFFYCFFNLFSVTRSVTCCSICNCFVFTESTHTNISSFRSEVTLDLNL